MTRGFGSLFVTETALTLATCPLYRLSVHDEPNVPGDGDAGPVDDLVAVVDAGLQVFCQRLIVLLDLFDGPVVVALGFPLGLRNTDYRRRNH
jgi:hypothetical protein